MMSLEHTQDEVSSLHGSTISLASGSHRCRSIETQPLQTSDQGDLGNATNGPPHDSSRSDESTQGRQSVKKESRPTTLRTVLKNSWLLEILSLIASWACQIWLVVILLQMNNRPLDTWLQKISLNAMVAALSTMSKALLLEPVGASIGQLKWLHLRHPRRMYDFELFDQASRGFLGSVSLLARFRIEMVSLGCFITILSAAVGPFTQQVISYTNRQVDVRNPSVTFGVAYNYNVANITGERYHGTTSPDIFDWSIRANILGALYNSKTPPVFNCTSSCAWDDTFFTLGFGHECRDVTEATTANRTCNSIIPFGSDAEPVDPYNGTLTQQCNMTTPGGVVLRPDHFPRFDGTWHTTTKYVSIASSSDYNYWYLRGPKHGKSYSSLVTLAQYERDPAFLHGGELKENITECEVSAVAWRYSGIKVEGNELAIANREKIPLDDAGDSIPMYEEFSSIISFEETGIQPMKISIWDWKGLDFFLVNLLSDISSVEGPQPWRETDDKPPIFATSVSGGGMAIWVARMTEAMTSALQSGPNRQLKEGISRDVVIFVQVNWLWYGLPLVVEVGSAILLAFVIWQSKSRHGIPLWKTSALAQWAYIPEQAEGRVIRLTLEEGLPDSHTVEMEAKLWKIQVH